MRINNFFKLVIAIVVSELAGVIGSIFTVSAIPTWYATLVKPALNPPAWAFGPVWTTLYALMGVALWLVWKKPPGATRKHAMVFFYAQLGLNALWPAIFFGQHFIGGAFREILALWICIVLTMIFFAKISRPAAWLLVPYILWVSFAAYLNYAIWMLN